MLQKRQPLLHHLIGGFSADLNGFSDAPLVKFTGLPCQVAKAIGSAAGTAISFVLNSCFNFSVSDKIALQLAGIFSIVFIGRLACAGLLHLLFGPWGLSGDYACLMVIVAGVVLPYNPIRLFSFGNAN